MAAKNRHLMTVKGCSARVASGRFSRVAMLGSDQTVNQMSRLDAFDEKFARERVAILLGQRRWKLRFATLIIVVALAIGWALTRSWVRADWRLLSEVQTQGPSLSDRLGLPHFDATNAARTVRDHGPAEAKPD